MQERLQEIVKRDGGLVALANILIEDQSAHGITEAEFTAAVTDYAKGLHPNATPDAAFVAVFSDSGADGVAIRKAHALTKGVYDHVDITPMMVGGPDAMHEAVDNTEQCEAYRQLQELGARKWPTATEAQQFANAFTDPANRVLAEKAHRTPRPPAGGAYPFPR